MPDFRDQLRRHYGSRSLSPEKVAEILARGRDTAGDIEESNEPGLATPPKRKITRRLFWGSFGAVAAALVAGIWVHHGDGNQVPFAEIQPRVVEFFAGDPKIPLVSQDKSELRKWLLERGAPTDFTVPAKLVSLESFGCDVVDVRGKPSFLTCFWSTAKPDRSGGDLVHLLVSRRADFSGTPETTQPKFEQRSGWTFATWAEGDVGYTVATLLPEERLREYVAFFIREPRWIASR